MARRSVVVRRSSSRPNRGWSVNTSAAFTVVPAASKVLLGTFVLVGGMADVTVLRVIGGVAVASDQTGANENQIGAVGLILVTDIAAAAGIASIPGPFTDGGDDGWFCHQRFAQQSASGNVPDNSDWYPIDTKGKRVWPGTGRVIAVVAENGHATHGLELYFAIRLLAQIRGTR